MHSWLIINTPFQWVLVQLALLFGNAPLAIILLAATIRLLLSPAEVMHLRSMRAMERLRPHIDELRKKHGPEKQRLTEETLKLYREHKAKPALGLLSLLHIPILIGLFLALRNLGATPATVVLDSQALFHSWLAHTYLYSETVYDLFHAKFLWINGGTAQPDPLHILPVLAGLIQWVHSLQVMYPPSGSRQVRTSPVRYGLLVGIVLIAALCPAGLSVYWMTSTTIGVIITVTVLGWRSLMDRPLPPSPRSSGPPEPGPWDIPPAPVGSFPRSTPPRYGDARAFADQSPDDDGPRRGPTNLRELGPQP